LSIANTGADMDIAPILEAARAALAPGADAALLEPALNSLRRALLYYRMSDAQAGEGRKLRTALERKRRDK
jgi:hypothetical protein